MSHIAGSVTRAETARMIDAVLQHKRALRLEYRCDSPSMARKFLMTIQPMKDDRALMVHDLRDAWHFSPPLNRWQYDAAAEDVKCSFCGDVTLSGEGEWTSCDDIGERHPSRVTYDICPRCVIAIENAVGEVLVGSDVAAPLDVDKLVR
jgi:hypothetical protein